MWRKSSCHRQTTRWCSSDARTEATFESRFRRRASSLGEFEQTPLALSTQSETKRLRKRRTRNGREIIRLVASKRTLRQFDELVATIDNFRACVTSRMARTCSNNQYHTHTHTHARNYARPPTPMQHTRSAHRLASCRSSTRRAALQQAIAQRRSSSTCRQRNSKNTARAKRTSSRCV